MVRGGQLRRVGRAVEVGKVTGPGQVDVNGSRQLGHKVVGDGSELRQVEASGDDGGRTGDAREVDLHVVLVHLVTGISTNFWKAVMTTVPATPAMAPRPSTFAAVEPSLLYVPIWRRVRTARPAGASRRRNPP